ncbi:MAG: cytochrome c1 [Alphaproteobacteria bacterium]|nr:cytochrome c1 [Alphaproteobacteria bacterium]
MKKILLFTLLGLVAVTPAYAAGDAPVPPHQDWSFNGYNGTFDKGSLQRGYQVYKQVCSACHGMKRISFRNLAALGYSEEEVKALAAEYTVMDGPNDEGEMFERPARPSDAFPSPYPNDETARYANNGALPPDLSLIVKARPHGADYIYGLLTGYEEHHGEEELPAGQYWNKYMAGHKIAMAPPLSDDMVPYEDETVTTTEQYSKDVTSFLAWAAEPELEERKRIGVKVILFLIAFAGVMLAVKRKIWASMH